jgi:uncharacterized protein YjbK
VDPWGGLDLSIPKKGKERMSTRPGEEQCELEFKLPVKNVRCFEAIARKLSYKRGRAVRQINYFFDTFDKDLEQKSYTLRVRDEEGHFKLTAKRSRGCRSKTALRDRDELEVELETQLAKRILAGQDMPFTALKQLSEPSVFLNDLTSLIVSKRQILIGSFQNERSTMGPITMDVNGESIELTFEMDRTTLPGGQVYYEVEVEVSESETERAERALQALWKELDFEWIVDTPGKFKRFRDAAKGQSSG